MKDEQPKPRGRPKKGTRKADHKRMGAEYETMPIKPTIPLVIMYQMALFWQKEARYARNNECRAKLELKRYKEGQLAILPRVVKVNPDRITKRLNRSDMVDLLMMAHVSIEAMLRMKQNPRENAFLNGAILYFAKIRTTVTVSNMIKLIGPYRFICGMNIEVGKTMSILRQQGYLNSTDANGDRVYFITDKGKKYARTLEDAINLVLTRSWRKPENEIIP